MNRIKKGYPFHPNDLEQLKKRMLRWANQSNILLFLDSNQYVHTDGQYECLCGIGARQVVKDDDSQLSQLKAMHLAQKDWLFGHVNYDFKNKLERLNSAHKASFSFPDLHFFCPEIVCYIQRGASELIIETLEAHPDVVWQQILATVVEVVVPCEKKITFKKRIEKAEYLNIIQQLQQHIVNGDCYEINFCNENFCPDAVAINPVSVFQRLKNNSSAPFAAFYKYQDQYLMCASPERFLRKRGNQIMAQPIKGTAARKTNTQEDEQQKANLLNSIKERAENVMIVDLMRNDLARFCEVDSVMVEELFGIYTFPNVHQMISTVSGQLKEGMSLFDAIRLSFPMGSMTGAPKIMVMQLIEQYEQARRELFSGSVGYISPDGDFDFNVVIRSLVYNEPNKYLSFQTGGAITFDSIPEQEWEETILKAAALERIFH